MVTKKPRALAREEAILGWVALILLGAMLTLLTIAALRLPPPPQTAVAPPGTPWGPTATVTISANGYAASAPAPAAQTAEIADDDDQ